MVKPSRPTVFIAIGLVALLAAVVVLAPRWARLLRRPLPGGEGGEAPAAAADEPAGAVERQISVKLFFQAGDRRGLAIEERPVEFARDLSRQVRLVVEQLIAGPRSGLLPTLAADTRVLEVFVSPRGVAYVDLSKEASVISPGGSEAEMMTVYSVVNTLTANFPAVRRVQLLLDDRPSPTLAGHVDLSRPLPSDMTLLAGSTPEPAPPPVQP
ncbi:MAG TPA: GerMN domain-containing protein [Vicinamibacteria bacterium]